MSIKLPGLCLDSNIWAEQYGGTQNTTVWRGEFVSPMLDLLQMLDIGHDQVDVITELPDHPNTTLHPLLAALSFGFINFLPAPTYQSLERYQYLDFSPATEYDGVYIITRKGFDEHYGNLLSGMFDMSSYALIGLSLIMTATYMCIDLKMSLDLAVLTTVQIIFHCGNDRLFTCRDRSRLVLGLTLLAFMSIIACFNGQILAKLLTKHVSANINTLEDLEQHPNLNIIVWENTYYQDFIESANNGRGVVNIVEPIDLAGSSEPLMQTFIKIYSGTHAFITERLFSNIICDLPGITMEDFHVSLPLSRRSVSFSFPKNRSKIVQDVFDIFGWLLSFGILDFNKKKYVTRFFDGVTSSITKQGHESPKCPNIPIDNRNVVVDTTKEKTCNRKETISVKPLNIQQLAMCFYFLLTGLGIATLAFVLEAIHYRANCLPLY